MATLLLMEVSLMLEDGEEYAFLIAVRPQKRYELKGKEVMRKAVTEYGNVLYWTSKPVNFVQVPDEVMDEVRCKK